MANEEIKYTPEQIAEHDRREVKAREDDIANGLVKPPVPPDRQQAIDAAKDAETAIEGVAPIEAEAPEKPTRARGKSR